MKKRIIVSAILVLLLSAGISFSSNAAPWGGGHGHGHGWCGPHIGVSVWFPPIRVFTPVVYGGYYGGYHRHPHYYAHGCGGYRHCGPRHGYR